MKRLLASVILLLSLLSLNAQEVKFKGIPIKGDYNVGIKIDDDCCISVAYEYLPNFNEISGNKKQSVQDDI